MGGLSINSWHQLSRYSLIRLFCLPTGCSEAREPAGVQGKARGNSRLVGGLGGLVHLLPDLWQRGTRAEQALSACVLPLPTPVQKSWRLLPPARPRHFSPAAVGSSAQCGRRILQWQTQRAEGREADPAWRTQVLHHLV